MAPRIARRYGAESGWAGTQATSLEQVDRAGDRLIEVHLLEDGDDGPHHAVTGGSGPVGRRGSGRGGCVVVRDGGGLTALDAADGAVLWTARAGDGQDAGWGMAVDGRRVLTIEPRDLVAMRPGGA